MEFSTFTFVEEYWLMSTYELVSWFVDADKTILSDEIVSEYTGPVVDIFATSLSR